MSDITNASHDPLQQLHQAVTQNAKWSVDGLLERLFAKTFTGLVYAQIWEDPAVDMEALEIQPDDHIVAIASGGCNVMSYLTANPASIVAVDLSPAHIALNRLKYAAAARLPDHDAFFSMFGKADQKSNTALFDHHIKPHLDVATIDWWNGRMGLRGRRIDMFTNGLYGYGALGQFIGWAHRIGSWYGIDFKQFMQSRNLEEQRHYFDTTMRPALNGRLIRWLVSNRISLFGLGIPPQQYEALASAADGDMHAVLIERTRRLMCDFPLSQNYFAWAAFNRGYAKDATGPLPPYLERRNFDTLKANAHKAHIENRTLTALLANCADASKDCYVLLDAQDWMTDAQLNDVWDQITRTARPNARVIFRTAGLDDILPGRVNDHILGQWQYDDAASKKGHEHDRSAIYGGFHLYRLRG